MKDKVGTEWYEVIGEEFKKPYMAAISKRVGEARSRTTVYPEAKDVFRAFKMTPFNKVKVVMIGQDPYHNGNATGLAFDCRKELSPSMEQMYWGYDQQFPSNFATDIMEGNLERWAENGVLLLNTSLTVEKGKPGSHRLTWVTFMQAVLRALCADPRQKVFILLGRDTDAIRPFITAPHVVLYREHPQAPNYRTPKGKWDHKNVFLEANKHLKASGQEPIDW
jgi:uracil-DNA glycosylase